MPSMPELLVILLIVLLIFGANKLPGIGEALGRSIKNFKRSSNGSDELEVSKKREIQGTSRESLKAGEALDDLDEAEVEEAEVLSKK